MDSHRPNLKETKWRQSMLQLINNDNNDVTTNPNIFRISKYPEAYSKLREKAYKPRLMTVGPFYKSLELEDMRLWKAKTIQIFMNRQGIPDKQLIEEFEFDQKPTPSKNYLDISDLEWVELVITINTIFLLELLITFPDDSTKRMARDSLLINNQIPMKFLLKLLKFYPTTSSYDFINIILIKFFMGVSPFDLFKLNIQKMFDMENVLRTRTSLTLIEYFHQLMVMKVQYIPSNTDNCMHCGISILHECRDIIREVSRERRRILGKLGSFILKNIRCSNRTATAKRSFLRLPRASQLRKANISFQESPGNISEIRYDLLAHRLTLPIISVKEDTEDVLRNLVAFEIMQGSGTDVQMYILIMDQLIGNEEDIAILEESNVIENKLGGSRQLVNMWKNMCIEKRYNKPEIEHMVHRIVADHSSSWHRWAIEFHAMLVSRPWYTVSFVSAFLLLLASMLQTVFAVLGYLSTKT